MITTMLLPGNTGTSAHQFVPCTAALTVALVIVLSVGSTKTICTMALSSFIVPDTAMVVVFEPTTMVFVTSTVNTGTFVASVGSQMIQTELLTLNPARSV